MTQAVEIISIDLPNKKVRLVGLTRLNRKEAGGHVDIPLNHLDEFIAILNKIRSEQLK